MIGIYPMLPEETCFFLAVDFDEENWQTDVAAVRSVCVEWGITAAVERSRSGHGAHLWVFFSNRISCALARRLGSGLLTCAMERNHTVKFDSYDRRFPSQDTMPYAALGYKAKASAHETLEKVGIIFDEKNFFGTLSQDVANSEKEILIVSPFLSKGRTMQMQKLMQETLIRGATVVVVTRPATDYKAEAQEKTAGLIDALENGGIKVITKEKIYQKFAILDEKIVWYGSVNLLSYGRSEESMMRFENVEIAAELVEDIQKEGAVNG